MTSIRMQTGLGAGEPAFVMYDRLQGKMLLHSVAQSARRASRAYLDPPAVAALWAAGVKAPDDDLFGTTEPLFIESRSTGAQAYVWRRGVTAFLTFRGTDSARDVVEDLRVEAVPLLAEDDAETRGVRVHAGVLAQFRSVEPAITRLVSSFAPPCTDLVVAGHSLGAALATLAGPHYARSERLRATCHTFGSPRCGNEAFTRYFARHVADHVRVINERDPVPMLPLRPVWRHAAATCLVLNGVTASSAYRGDVSLAKRLWMCVPCVVGVCVGCRVQDHSLDVYNTRLDRAHT